MVNKDVTKVCIGKIEELPEQLGKTVYIEDKELAVFKLASRYCRQCFGFTFGWIQPDCWGNRHVYRQCAASFSHLFRFWRSRCIYSNPGAAR